MAEKYIIYRNDHESIWRMYADENGDVAIEGVAMTPYTEPDLEQVRKEAYDKGYNDATEEIGSDEQTIADKAYKHGLSDAWEAARKISSMDSKTRDEIFGLVITSNIFDENTASEAIEKIRQYEQERDAEIKVGDEIEAVSGKAVVVYVDDVDEHKVRYVYSNGVYAFNYIDKVTKTGRHFPEIAEVLKKMREE